MGILLKNRRDETIATCRNLKACRVMPAILRRIMHDLECITTALTIQVKGKKFHQQWSTIRRNIEVDLDAWHFRQRLTLIPNRHVALTSKQSMRHPQMHLRAENSIIGRKQIHFGIDPQMQTLFPNLQLPPTGLNNNPTRVEKALP